MQSVRLTAQAVGVIAEKARASEDGRETGGILLGFDAGDLGEALVMEAGGPGPTAERRRDFFQRDLEHATKLANGAFARTTARWIGEWHTHPRGGLSPSRTDLRTYRGLLRDPELDFRSFVAVIVGPGEEGYARPRAAAWLIELRRILPALLLPNAAQIEVAFEPIGDGEGAEE